MALVGSLVAPYIHFATLPGLQLEQWERTMSDEKLLAEVARVWVDGGGDAGGISWCYQKLIEAVHAEIKERERHISSSAVGESNE